MIVKLGGDTTIGKKGNIYRRLTYLYILALSAVAFLTIAGQILVQYAINDNLHDSKVINFTGRQRFQSQGMVKSILMLTDTSFSSTIDRQLYIAQLTKFHTNWSTFHKNLREGYWQEYNISIAKSATIDSMFTDLEPHYEVLNTNILFLIEKINENIYREDVSVRNAINTIMAHETQFLNQMDKIVFQFDKEAKAKVDRLKKIERILLVVTILILLVEGFLIFRPAVYQIKNTIQMLQESEQKTQAMNKDLQLMNHTLQKAEEELLEATRQKYRQQINEQRVRSVSLIQGQESERKRIARELHDGIGQMLTAIKINSARLGTSTEMSDKDKKLLDELRILIQDTLSEVKNISFNLMPAVLNDFGLVPALKILCERVMANSIIHIELASDLEKEPIEKDLEIGIYRIAQEAINNAVKYSEASEIKIDLSQKLGYVFLNISDNGKGFSRKKITNDQRKEKTFSTGLNSMEERTNMFDGEIRIVSGTGKGTKIYVKLPLNFRLYEQDKGNTGG